MRGQTRISAFACLWLSFLLSPALAAPAASFTIHDFMPDFWQFWEAAENQPVERRAELWQSLYVSKHQAVFDDLAGPCKDQWEPTWARTRYFPNLPKIAPSMRDATVALGQKDLSPGMTHELFHRYHHQFFDFEGSSNYPLWTVLWAEGMAQYVSEQFNPGASDADLAHVPFGTIPNVDARRQELAADFLKRFASTQEADAKIYFNDTNSNDAFVPARAGYELGVLVAKELAKQYPIQTMAHWSQSEAQPKIQETLTAMANAPR